MTSLEIGFYCIALVILLIAAAGCPSLHDKRVTAHVLRHTAAMRLLGAGVDTSVIALWLGHERLDTTQIYLHADLALKERALARTTPPDSKPQCNPKSPSSGNSPVPAKKVVAGS